MKMFLNTVTDEVFDRVFRWLSGKESACQCRRLKSHAFHPRVRKISWRRAWQLTPVFLTGVGWQVHRVSKSGNN